jgi:hypothetical protein
MSSEDDGEEYDVVEEEKEQEQDGGKKETPLSSGKVEITHRKHNEEHSKNPFGPYVKAMVYAGLDGIVSIYVGVIIAVLTTGEHQRFQPHIILPEF